jgi:hypothetical protein
VRDRLGKALAHELRRFRSRPRNKSQAIALADASPAGSDVPVGIG